MKQPLICLILVSVFFLTPAFVSRPALAQQELTREDVQPMGEWLEFRKARYVSKPILIHLRTGYERAVLMPEPVRLKANQSALPGCTIEIDAEVIGFYPTRTFARLGIKFIGLDTGKEYELRVRASTSGIRQPLQITR